MPELIDRQAALRVCIEGDGYDDEGFTEGYNFAVSEIREKLQTLPTSEPEERHGRWADNGEDKWICSACKGYVWRWFGKQNFCPNCGAKMRGE